MKTLLASKPEYELAAKDIKRITPLMDEIVNQGIEFKYLITMNYPYRITDYTKVLRHSRHLKYVLNRNFDNPKIFITNEKHTNSSNILDPFDKTIYDSQFFDSCGRLISLYGSIHKHIAIDVSGTNMRKITAAIKTYCSKDFCFKRGGYDIKKVTNQKNLMSYMTKDIDRPNLPNLGIERDKVIDSVSSDIGKDHYSVKNLAANPNTSEIIKSFEKLYKSVGKK